MQEYNIPSILDEPIAFDAIVPTQQTTQFKALISQMVAEETARQSVERDALIDRLRVELKCERQKRKALEARLDNVESWQATYSEEIARDKRRIFALEERPSVTNSQPTTIATKTEKRLERLDEWLFWRSTHTATYSEIGKYLELGTRDSKGKNTRRQHMYEFSKILKQFPDRYIIEETGHNNGKRITLSSGWLRHLRIQDERKEVSS